MVRRHDDPPDELDDAVARAIPLGVRIAGAWSWRVIGVILLLAGFIWLFIQLHIVVIPVMVAVLLSGLLTPVKNRLIRFGWPRWLAVATTFLGLLIVIAGLVVVVVLTLRAGATGFEARITKGYDSILTWLESLPFGITESSVNGWLGSLASAVQKNESSLVSGALTGASTVGDILVGLVLSLFVTLFFLIDGVGIWRWCVRLAPRAARAAVDGAGRAAWLSVGEYVRVQIIVALLDAIGIGLVAFLLGLPFVVPIAVLVFLAAFIPIVGAVSTGALAVIVALLYNDPVSALIMLAGVIGVNQLESHVLQPLLMGNAVRLHPIAVVLSVGIGSLVGGIGGAVFAVPLAAALNSAIRYVAGGEWKDATGHAEPPPPTDPPKPSRRLPLPKRRPKPQDVTTVA